MRLPCELFVDHPIRLALWDRFVAAAAARPTLGLRQGSLSSCMRCAWGTDTMETGPVDFQLENLYLWSMPLSKTIVWKPKYGHLIRQSGHHDVQIVI